MPQTVVKDEEVVTISRNLWERVKENPAFVELLEDIEDAQDILKAKAEASEFFDFDEYIKERRRKQDVSNKV
ncbi:MAG: hypothetical protein QME81_01890 [bacterium]|nr:hypothetical protein [bacterium]